MQAARSLCVHGLTVALFDRLDVRPPILPDRSPGAARAIAAQAISRRILRVSTGGMVTDHHRGVPDVASALDGIFAGEIANNYQLVREAIDQGVPLGTVKPGNNISTGMKRILFECAQDERRAS